MDGLPFLISLSGKMTQCFIKHHMEEVIMCDVVVRLTFTDNQKVVVIIAVKNILQNNKTRKNNSRVETKCTREQTNDKILQHVYLRELQ